mmetsp:Transcript_35288/g.69533  ORF Transcript_35288/g.69533 Transcript_35288/m.69533 type:complete len:88 (-) Transcript_35288:9-272(-)
MGGCISNCFDYIDNGPVLLIVTNCSFGRNTSKGTVGTKRKNRPRAGFEGRESGGYISNSFGYPIDNGPVLPIDTNCSLYIRTTVPTN